MTHFFFSAVKELQCAAPFLSVPKYLIENRFPFPLPNQRPTHFPTITNNHHRGHPTGFSNLINPPRPIAHYSLARYRPSVGMYRSAAPPHASVIITASGQCPLPGMFSLSILSSPICQSATVPAGNGALHV